MALKYKMTPFARLLIFLIFFVPIVYVGMGIYNGDDTVQKLKDFFSPTAEKTETGVISKDRFGVQEGTNQELIQVKNKEIKELEARIKRLEREIRQLGG